MNYLEFTFNCHPAQDWQQDLFINELGDIGFDTFEQIEEGFKAYIPELDFNSAKLESLLSDLDSSFWVNYHISSIAPQNWNALWESNFQPIFIKDKVCVRATFHEIYPDFPIEIVIDPKMAFGTGHHQTTSLMMEYMLEEDFAEKTVLDMGCGTGILGILAAKLSAKSIVSIDNDAVCVDSSKENQQINKINNMNVKEGSYHVIPNQEFEVILANINRNILLEHLSHYSIVMKEGGQLFLSGFYQGEDLELLKKEAKASGFEFVGYKTRDNWVAAKFNFTKENL